jgi:DNA-binding NarL/FixJ family response regulator
MTTTTDRTTPGIVALAADMIFASKIRGTADAVGVPVMVVTTAGRLIEALKTILPRLVLIDLDTRGLDIGGVIADVREASPDAEILAYVSHVRVDAIEAARVAGAHQVLARSAFTRTLPEILKRGSAPADFDHS